MDLSLMWAIVLIILILAEIFTFNLVSIWFVIGSIVAFAMSFFNDNMILQILVFVVVSLLTLIITKPLCNKYMNKKRENTNLDSVVGKIAIVVKEPTKTSKGQAKVEGKIWTVVSEDILSIDDKVEVEEIEGVKLKVRKVKK